MRASIILALVLVAGCKSRDREHPLAEAAKACAKNGELSCPRPIFNVHSLKASQAYYRDALGFTLDWDHGDPPNFGSVSRSETSLFMCEQCQSNPGAWVMVFTGNVDPLHEEFVRNKAIIRMPPTNMPWGLREMHVADLDGNVIRFGSSIDH